MLGRMQFNRRFAMYIYIYMGKSFYKATNLTAKDILMVGAATGEGTRGPDFPYSGWDQWWNLRKAVIFFVGRVIAIEAIYLLDNPFQLLVILQQNVGAWCVDAPLFRNPGYASDSLEP